MRRAALKQAGFGSLVLIAASLLIALQTLSVQHVHADEPELPCVLCVATQHDDDPLPVARLEHYDGTVSSSHPAGLPPKFQTVEQPLQLARAPPAH